MPTIHKFAIAILHFFLATFIWVQVSAPLSLMLGENIFIDIALFFLISVSIFYLSFKKAESPEYSISKVLLITAGYFIASTLLVILSWPYFNIVLVVGLYYFLIKKDSQILRKNQELSK